MRTPPIVILALIAAVSGLAQTPEVSIETPKPPRFAGPILRPFHVEKRRVSPARLEDSPRLEALVRAGNLYLSARDVIALALENNLDIALQRYGPFLAREALRRTEAGNLLRTVDTPVLQGPQSVSTAGISSTGLAGGASVAAVGTVLAQVGAPLPNLDPTLSAQVQLGHQTSPETDTIFRDVRSGTRTTRATCSDGERRCGRSLLNYTPPKRTRLKLIICTSGSARSPLATRSTNTLTTAGVPARTAVSARSNAGPTSPGAGANSP